MPRVKSQIARRDYPAQGIKKGERYYSWKFYRGRKRMSKTPPKQSELTQREDYGHLRSAQEIIEELEWGGEKPEWRETLAAGIADAITELEAARDASQDKYDNMPEQWQGADMGQNAENFCSECDDAISELESIKSDLENEDTAFDEIDDPNQISWPQEY